MPTCFLFAPAAEVALLDFHEHRCLEQPYNQGNTTWHDEREARLLLGLRTHNGTTPSRTNIY